MEPKSFDINVPSRVNPSATSRPVIVGHRPIMTDPMMRPASAGPLPSAPAPVHVAKVIQVSDEVRNDLVAAQPLQMPTSNDKPPEPLAAVSPEPPHGPDTLAEPAGSMPPASSIPPPTVAAPLPPAPEPDLTHLPHVPIAHTHHQQSKVKNAVLWFLIIGFLLIFAAYVLIDAGLVSSSIKLPVHIFNQSS